MFSLYTQLKRKTNESDGNQETDGEAIESGGNREDRRKGKRGKREELEQ